MSNEVKSQSIDLGFVASADFEPHIGETFQAHRPDGSVLTLTLQSIKEKPLARMSNAPVEKRMPFSLTLSGRKEAAFLSDIVFLVHESMGTFENLLISQVMSQQGMTDPDSWYQIVFN